MSNTNVVIPDGADSVVTKEGPLSVENNGIEFPLVVESFKKGNFRGQGYLTTTIEKSEAGLATYIKFRGLEDICDYLQSRENLNNQAALVAFSSPQDGVDEEGKPIRFPSLIAWDSYLNAIATSKCRGETIRELDAQCKELSGKIVELAEQMVDESGEPDLAVMGEVKRLGRKVKELESQIESKRRNKADEDDN
jgi:hypothetical protein